MMTRYEQLVYRREDTVDGIGPWYWIKTDSGAWDGPKRDWEECHSRLWFKRVKSWDVCFQAGSCLGMYPRLLAEKFAQVYSVEPDPLNSYVAKLNCQWDNIHLFNAAVGQESGTFTGILRNQMDNVGMHKTGGQGTTPIVSIDSFHFPSLGLLALDIEGYEYYAIKGALQTIDRCSPVVVLECPRQETTDMLIELGYVAEEVSVSDTVFVRN